MGVWPIQTPSNGNTRHRAFDELIGEAVAAATAADGDDFIAFAPHFVHFLQNFISAWVELLDLHPQNADNGLKPYNTTINQYKGTMFAAGGGDHGHEFDPGGPIFHI